MIKQNVNKSNRKLQIGVMGSAADLKYAKSIEKLAEEVGYWVAKKGATLVFGAEKDYDSLSTSACRGAKKANGLTVGVTYGKGLEVYEKNADVIIASGLERGGGRETTLVLSCDAIITISGGSGTLTEMAIAYQANIPIVVLKNTGGWSAKLAGQFIDGRKRVKADVAKNPKQAVSMAIKSIESKSQNNNLLFLAATHGDEDIGVKAINKLEEEKLVGYDSVIANEKAFKKKQRFVNVDLNRVAPGNETSSKYELLRANELVKLSRKYDKVIDIHGTNANIGIITIVTNPTLENLFLAYSLPINIIVVWSSSNSRSAGPITQFVRNGIEIECGLQNSDETLGELIETLKTIIRDNLLTNNISNFSNKKRIFKVYGKIKKDNVKKSQIKKLIDFKKCNLNGESFYPLLVGQYKNNDVVCYKMEKVNMKDIFTY